MDNDYLNILIDCLNTILKLVVAPKSINYTMKIENSMVTP